MAAIFKSSIVIFCIEKCLFSGKAKKIKKKENKIRAGNLLG